MLLMHAKLGPWLQTLRTQYTHSAGGLGSLNDPPLKRTPRKRREVDLL